MFTNGLVHNSSNAQKHNEDLLIDVSKPANEIGFNVQVLLTHRIWCQYIVCNQHTQAWGINEATRLCEILFTLFRVAMRRGNTNIIIFRVRISLSNQQTKIMKFKAVIGPDKNGIGVITIMLPIETPYNFSR
ncbi:MAG: hypothetical protein JW841_11870 [Deltaproteobacteria bacterium]|nr:hypothetical protein [Deltaproteobacteria bacterium]